MSSRSRRALRGAMHAAASALLLSCASGSTPPASPAPSGAAPAQATTEPAAAASARTTSPGAGRASPASGPVASTTTSVAGSASPDVTAAAGSADECRVQAELARAYEKLGQGAPRAQWIENAGAKLLTRVIAERTLTGISQEIVSAIAHRRYDKLAAFAGKDGVCMRVARGAPCRVLSARELAGCADTRVRTEWDPGSGGEPLQYSCGEAFRRIFYSRDFLHVGRPSFNCFPDEGSSTAEAPIIASGPHFGYVELRSEAPDGTRSLWLVFGGDPRAPELVEMISDHPGSRSAANP